MRLTLISRALAAFLLAAVAFAGQVQAQDGGAVLDRLRAKYESLDALRARFTQTVGGEVTEGTLVFRGDQYRIETGNQTLVTDGRTTWVYSKPEAQVLVNDYVEDETGFSPTEFFTRYPERYDVAVRGSETIGGTRHDILALTPKNADAYIREVTLYVRSTDALPTRVRVTDGNGTQLTFDLRDVEVNPALSAEVFRFTPPSGVEVVDLRS